MEKRLMTLSRCLAICGTALLIAVYGATYILIREEGLLVHRTTFEKGKNRHSIVAGEPPTDQARGAAAKGPKDPAAADALTERARRREKLLVALYAPARWAEVAYRTHLGP